MFSLFVLRFFPSIKLFRFFCFSIFNFSVVLLLLTLYFFCSYFFCFTVLSISVNGDIQKFLLGCLKSSTVTCIIG